MGILTKGHEMKSWFWLAFTAAIGSAILSLRENTTIGIICLMGASTALGIKIAEISHRRLNHD